MNPTELKNHLNDIARHQGEKALSRDELDFMHGRISYNTYLDRCYAQYCKGKLSKKKPLRG